MCKELKPIYQAVDADAAERALERFRNTTMGKKYPAIIQIWERAWAQVIPFFQFAPEIRTQIPSGLLPCPSSLCCLVSGLLVSWSKLTRLPLRGAR